MKSPRTALCLCLAICCAWLCRQPLTAEERVVIVGSGSFLPVRLYQEWMREFNKGNQGIELQYLPLGSSESMVQISHGVGDFGSGEVPLTNKQMHGSKISLIPIPTALVGIVPIYNLPGNPELNFSGELLGQIYLGTVKNWRDARIAKLNPNVELPDLAIGVVHRSSGKGSNYILTDFLSKTNSQFRAEIGANPSPKWPVGVEADRSQDMLRKVGSTSGAIGYVELGFLANSRIGRGRVQNAAGRFVSASSASIEASCASLKYSSPDVISMDITNAPGRDAYPIASFTWIYLPARGLSARRNALKKFLKWCLQDGQNIAKRMGYAPLPTAVAASALAAIDSAQ